MQITCNSSIKLFHVNIFVLNNLSTFMKYMFLEILSILSPFITDKRHDGNVDDGADRCVNFIFTSL